MSRVRSSPFLTVSKATPLVDWRSGDGSNLRSEMGEWDQQSTLHVRVAVELSPDAILDELGLGPSSTLRLSLACSCAATQLTRRLDTADFTVGNTQSLTLEGTLTGRDVRDRVNLEALLTLASCDFQSHALSPRVPGSLVWKAGHRVDLGQNLAGFPVMWVDFEAASHLPDRAAWHLDWDPTDLERELSSGVRLWLNSGHEAVVNAVQNPESPGGKAVLEFLMYDLGRRLIRGALSQPEFSLPQEEYPPGSLGTRIRALCETAFGGMKLGAIAARASSQPARFERDLQHGLRFLDAVQ